MSLGERRLLALPRFADRADAYRPGLDRMRALLAAVGDPHDAVPAVHVAGTNGKGSTASLTASVAQAAGKRVGLHTSPHLVTLRERMRVDGVPAPTAWLDAAVDRLWPALEAVGPSFFEATVALSFLYFAEQAADLAVIEVGLGGRLDATNVLTPQVSVVTHVGLDHTDLLGDTVADIAREKAGIAKDGVPFVHAVVGDGREALEAEAHRRSAAVEAVRDTCRVDPLQTPVADYGPTPVGLPGAHQTWNAALAVRAAEVAFDSLGWALPQDAVRVGLSEVADRAGLRGRGQPWVGDARVVLDVAHNADGWQAGLDAALADKPASAEAEGETLWALVGVLADKDASALANVLADRADRVFALGLDGERALSADALIAILADGGVTAEPVADAQDAIDAFCASASPADRLWVSGSHQTVAAVLGARTPGDATG